MPPPTKLTPSSSEVVGSPTNEDLPGGPPLRQVSSSDVTSESPGARSPHGTPDTSIPIQDSTRPRPSFSRPVFRSFQMKSARVLSRSASEWPLRRGESSLLHPQEGKTVGGPTELQRSVSMTDMAGVRYAGEASVYYNEEVWLVPRIVACISAICVARD